MAGDWIKVEKATARKPEVLRIADILGVHPDHAFAMCVRFWFWCDDQMTDGHAFRVTNVTLDFVIGHAGFSSALISVGWLRVRDGSLEVPNFDRHLSESAKNRVLSCERKKNQRSKASRLNRDKSVTREEKSIEDKERAAHTPTETPDGEDKIDQEGEAGSSQTKPPRVAHRFVKPTLNEIALYCESRSNGVDPEKFFDHYEANGWVQGNRGKPIKDWRACVRTWERSDVVRVAPAVKTHPTPADRVCSGVEDYNEFVRNFKGD